MVEKMLKCSRCKKLKPVSEFSEYKKGRFRRFCKQCRERLIRGRVRRLLQENPELYYRKKMAITKKSIVKHHEKRRRGWIKYTEKYQKAHPESVKAFRIARNIPKDTRCIFCSSTENLKRRFLDYNYPEVFITCCSRCFYWSYHYKPIAWWLK